MAGRTRNTTSKDEGVFRKTVFMGREVTFEESRACIVPVPYATTSYTMGTKYAPEEILLNWNVEDYDLELGYSPCFAGIYPLPEREYEGDDGLELIGKVSKEIFGSKKFPVFLGGDQALTIATTKAAAEIFGDLTVVFFDAHADLKDSFEGNAKSNMSVVKRMAEGIKTIQIGVRSIGSEELDEVAKRDAFNKITEKEFTEAMKKTGKNVYVSIDVDVFDPSVMPATPMPEQNGMMWGEIVGFIRRIAAGRNLVGCDITELSPIQGINAHPIMCAQLAYKLIGIKFESQAKEEGWPFREKTETGEGKK